MTAAPAEGRPQPRTVAIAATAVAVAAAVAVGLSGAPAPHRVAQAAAVSQASATALCSTSGPGGTWTISAARDRDPGPGRHQPTNLIQNNSARWALALAALGYQGPAPSATSQQVSNAINQASATDSDLVNAVAQAIMGLVSHGFDTSVDCATAESDPNWYSNAIQAHADEDLPAQLENQALNAIARQIQQWANQAQPASSSTPLPARSEGLEETRLLRQVPPDV